jgi:hypothetical protein
MNKIEIVTSVGFLFHKNLNLRSSVTGLFNSDLRFQGQFSADGNCSDKCWESVEAGCTANISKKHAAVHILRVKLCRVVSGPGSTSGLARAPLILMLYVAPAYSSKT